MPSRNKQREDSSFLQRGYLETPFFDKELFIKEAEPELEARLAALEAENPYQNAFEQDRTRLSEPWELESLGRTPEQETGKEEGTFERDIPLVSQPTNCGFHGLSGVVVTEASLRSEVVKIALQERQKWWDSTSKTFQKEDNDKRFGDLVRYWLAGLNGEIHPGKLEAVQQAALDSSITYGNLSDTTLNDAIQKFGVAEKKVNDLIEKVYKLSDVKDSAKFFQDSTRAKFISADKAVKKAEDEVRKAEVRVRAARGQSRPEAQEELDKKRVSLGTATTALSAARQDLDAKKKDFDKATRDLKTATRDLEEAKTKVREAKNARNELTKPGKPASKWKLADRLKIRKALLAKAASTDPQNINTIIDEALMMAHRSRADIEAWSAVFVVSCVRTAAIDLKLEAIDTRGAHVGKNGLLKASMKHAEYIIEARERKRKGIGGTYHAFEPRDRVVQIGDIICTDRMDFISKPVTLREVVIGKRLHCDIVTSINPENGKPAFAETIGGNVQHTVRRRRYPLDSQGLLVVSKGQLFAQEEDNGTFPPFEIRDPVLTMLATKSTDRIFALLSPVCKPASVPTGKGAQTGKGTSTEKRGRFLKLSVESLESPFFDEEILPAEQQDEFDYSVERLVDESLFVGAFEKRRRGFDEDQLEEEEVPDELENWEELETEGIWEELEEAQLTPQADPEEEESLDDEGALLYEDEMELESSEDLDEIYSHVPEHELDLDKELAELEEIEDLESDEEEHIEYDVPTLGSVTTDHSLREIADGQRGQLSDDILEAILTSGESDANDLTNRVFWQKHTDLSGKKLDPKDPKQKALREEWGRILRRQVKPIIWLRQIIDQLDRHRGDIPREFLLGWMAAESDGKVSTVSTLGERGYFQIMWKSGEAKEQLGLSKDEFLRLSTDREFSIEKGVQLVKKYRQYFLQKYPALPNDLDLLLRLTKGRHALPSALDKVLNRLVKAGTTITWKAVSKSMPKLARSVNLTLDYAAKLKKLADLVPTPPAATPELYVESAAWVPESEYEDLMLDIPDEQAMNEDLEEFDEEEIGDSNMSADDSDKETLYEFDIPSASFEDNSTMLSNFANDVITDSGGGANASVNPFSEKRYPANMVLAPSNAHNTRLATALKAERDNLRNDSSKKNLDNVSIIVAKLTPNGVMEYAGTRETDMFFSGSLLKVALLYASFELVARVNKLAPLIKVDTTKDLRGRTREFFDNVSKEFGNKIASAVPKITPGPWRDVAFDKALKASETALGVFNVSMSDIHYRELKSIFQNQGQNVGAINCMHRLGFSYVNGALEAADFFNIGTEKGIWMATDYIKDNPPGHNNWPSFYVPVITSGISAAAMTVLSMANLLSRIHREELVDSVSSQKMRAIYKTGGAWLSMPQHKVNVSFSVKGAKVGHSDSKDAKVGFVKSEAAFLERKRDGEPFIAVWQNVPDQLGPKPIYRVISEMIKNW